MLDYLHLPGETGACIFVTFSAWSPSGRETYFGKSYFEKKGYETFLIRHRDSSNWWHESEINAIAEEVKSRAIEVNKKIVLYGSSMGAYAAVHFRDRFDASVSIAIAPQIFLLEPLGAFETRWTNDLKRIRACPVLVEADCLSSERPLKIFWDPYHALDNQHVQLCSSIPMRGVELFPVPHSNHDAARVLNKSGILKKILEAAETGVWEKNLADDCMLAYLNDAKSFFNWFRKSKEVFSTDDILAKLIAFEADPHLDFEAYYMLAECYARLKMFTPAMKNMDISIMHYRDRFKKEIPSYLDLKRTHLAALKERDAR